MCRWKSSPSSMSGTSRPLVSRRGGSEPISDSAQPSSSSSGLLGTFRLTTTGSSVGAATIPAKTSRATVAAVGQIIPSTIWPHVCPSTSLPSKPMLTASPLAPRLRPVRQAPIVPEWYTDHPTF